VEDRAPSWSLGRLHCVAKKGYIATLIERPSRFAVLIKVPSKETKAMVAALRQHLRQLPAALKCSLMIQASVASTV
jgi:IS30 family transposase